MSKPTQISDRPENRHLDEKFASENDQRPEIVLVHGWGVNRQVWQTLLPKLSPFFRVNTLDIGGYGPCDQSSVALSMESAVTDLLRQAPKKATWVGWSLGGTLAIKAALAEPNRIERLILLGVTPHYLASADWQWGMEEAALTELLNLFQRDFRKGLKRFLLMQTSDRQKVSDLVPAIENFRRPDSFTLAQTLRFLTETDLRGLIPQVKVPIASLIGRHDKIVSPRASAELQRLVPKYLHIQPSIEGNQPPIQPSAHESNGMGQREPTASIKIGDENELEAWKGVFTFSGGHLFFLDSPERFVAVLKEIISRSLT